MSIRYLTRLAANALSIAAGARDRVALAYAKRTVQPVLEDGVQGPHYLGLHELRKLEAQYPRGSSYGYDPDSVRVRGVTRARKLIRWVAPHRTQSFLEIGCGDAMMSAALCTAGYATTAVDLNSDNFDPRARQAGVTLLEMDASALEAESDSYDCVFSYNSFEHFPHPEQVLQEMIRVTKPGGHIYLSFGPLYMSPFGEHAYRTISVPYCQFLFSRETLNAFAQEEGLKPIDFSHVNGWSLERFRALWKAFSQRLDVIHYREKPNLNHLDLVRTYPSCFRSKTATFDDLVIAHIDVLFRKRSSAR